MDISFTGIQNIKILQKSYNKYGLYLSNDKTIRKGDKAFNEIRIKCDLTEDSFGHDLNDFYKAITVSGPNYQIGCINKKNPRSLVLDAKGFVTKDDFGKTGAAFFKINNYDIFLLDDKVLALYTYLAKITRKIAAMPDMSPRQKHFAQTFNDFVSMEACKYLDLPRGK